MTNYTIDQIAEAAAVRRALASEADYLKANGDAITGRELHVLAMKLPIKNLLRLSAIIAKVTA